MGEPGTGYRAASAGAIHGGGGGDRCAARCHTGRRGRRDPGHQRHANRRSRGGGVTATRSQGVRINVRIEGPIEPTVHVCSITMEIDESVNPFAASDLNVRYVLHNTGNIRLGVDQSIGVRSLFGDVKSTRPASPSCCRRRSEVSHRVAGAVRFGRACTNSSC